MRIGCTESHQLSVDLDESIISGLLQQQHSSSSLLSGSPPQSGRTSPPSTPSSAQLYQQSQQQQQFQAFQNAQESLELQIDYWPIVKPGVDKDRNQTKATDQGKNSIKSTFRGLQVRFQSNCQHIFPANNAFFAVDCRYADFHWIHSRAKFPKDLLSIMLPKRKSRKVNTFQLQSIRHRRNANIFFVCKFRSNETGQEEGERSWFGERAMRWWRGPFDLLSKPEAIAPSSVKRYSSIYFITRHSFNESHFLSHFSLHRWHRMDWCKILSIIITVANTR